MDTIAVDVQLLKQEIDFMGIKYGVLAEKCGISRQAFDNKMKKPELFTARDVLNLAKALKVPVGSDQFVHIFFASAVEENGSGVEKRGEE